MNIRNRTHQAGLSIIEMMISITIGLLILAGLSAILVNNSRARTEIERANRQIENGRYAMQLLSDDLRLAGYTAEFDPSPMSLPTPTTNPPPDPCLTAVGDLRNNFMLHVQGVDNAATIPSCLSDVKSGTDILVIRRASTCKAGVGDCTAAAADGTPYFQASLCFDTSELKVTITGNSSYLGAHYQLDTNLASMTLRQRDCATVAGIQRFRTHIYFIANNNTPGDGIPTLKRAELGPGSGSATVFEIVPLVDGIENLQIQYGIDLPTADGAPDSYMANPATIDNWGAAVSAKINLLARNIEPTVGYSSDKTYLLGYDASDNPIVAGPFADNYKRHAYQSQVRLYNPAGRRLP